MFKIGAMVESFRLGLEGGLAKAAELGVDGVQISATGGNTHPAVLMGAARSKLHKRIQGLGLAVAAVCGDFGGHGFQMESENRKKIADSKLVVELALDLGCSVVTTHIGVIPAGKKHPRYAVMAKACEELGAFAGSRGATFAIETGPESAQVLRNFLDDIGIVKGIGVNFDPANLVMVCREDIPAAVKTLAKYIVHTHAKDGINLKPVDPEILYGAFAEPVPGFDWREYIKEVPLGAGGVPFKKYLKALSAGGYNGYLTIEREVGDNPAQDIAAAVVFLKKMIREL